jgi:hypothetical protein
MMIGEGFFYIAWIATWGVVAISIHNKMPTTSMRVYNFLAPLALFAGPGQIMLVCVIPVVVSTATGGSVNEGMANGMSWYCTLRTGITYIIAVLFSHLFTAKISIILFKNESKKRLSSDDNYQLGN